MIPILKKEQAAPDIFELVVRNPRLARKAQPGHFVLVMADSAGERIPLTIADFDRDAGTITMVVMAVGTSTRKLVSLNPGDCLEASNPGDCLEAMIGPLGQPSEIHHAEEGGMRSTQRGRRKPGAARTHPLLPDRPKAEAESCQGGRLVHRNARHGRGEESGDRLIQ